MGSISRPTVDPQIGQAIQLGDVRVNVFDAGSGPAVLLIHGSGPGVTAFANWRLVIPDLQGDYRVVAPDLLGFGYTEASEVRFDLARWVAQCVGLLDALGLSRVDVVGNSFGGSVRLRLALDHPDRVNRLVIPVSSSQLLAGQIPGARLEVIPECGHWVQTEKTAEFSALVREFLAEEGP